MPNILVPRHISQDHDEFFVLSDTPPVTNGIPSHLLLLPRDANYLVDVFFDHAYFYYPIINRATVELCLMEPQTPQALFLLNVVFMTACKHLARNSDVKRAIQFRERAREVQFHIEGKIRHTRTQGMLLGFLVVYGVFHATIGLAQLCGTYNALPTTPTSSDSGDNPLLELQLESRSLQADKGVIPEAAYQSRLWTFWGLFIRDSVSRLYFGWPHGMDTMNLTAELPKIEGFIGIGGKRTPPSIFGAQTTSVTGKRRGSLTFKKDRPQPEKRQMTEAETETGMERRKMSLADQAIYRNTIPDSDDDEDDIGESQLNPYGKRGTWDALHETEDGDPADQDRDEQGRLRLLFGIDGSRNSAKDNIRTFSVLSPKILELQSQGNHHLGTQLTDPVENSLHMERMKLLLDSEDDPTDGGSYCRVLFLEEVRLWSLGRRVALYLAGRSSNDVSMSVSVCPMTTNKELFGSEESSDLRQTLVQEGTASSSERDRESLADRLSTGPHNGAGAWSEQAWLQDHELQNIQADLIAWEKALPEYLKFRPDVDSDDVNHKVNGKMSILTMSYYTITIMLQSSYLPIPQFLASRRTGASGRSSSPRPSGRSSRETEGDTSSKSSSTPASRERGASLQSASTSTTDSATPSPVSVIYPHSESDSITGRAQPTSTKSQSQTTTTSSTTSVPSSSSKANPNLNKRSSPSIHEYFNTPHQICTQLTNVLLHHIELMVDSYPNWCTVAAKVSHALTAAQRVCCLNARLNSSSRSAREEARAEFLMATDLYKRLAHLPGPLIVRDWPVEEDIQVMMALEEEFKEMMMTQTEQDEAIPSKAWNAELAIDTQANRADALSETQDITAMEEETDRVGARSGPRHLFGLADEQEEGYKFDFHQESLP
ncbi:hypothetical protein BGX28_008978 [Mortierella sp. GBA30]|nr:hypothetical protein BGX28_008978 [Mortierella sp. GBA30]